ncbi:MAG TPA: tRNA dihydrouridine synthase DusB [Candidatus Kapabacteria bacterium]|nr:tRNA dihydrouridine synthase DusB [Candidatus Kapabacteria bacterium]
MARIGHIDLGEKPLLLAPMEDVSDVSFRITQRRMGADVVYTEFISSEAIIRQIAKQMKKMAMLEEERPLAIQIYGGDPEHMAEAAQVSEAASPDFLDINCGCWVKNVAGKGAGAGLLKDLPRMEKMTRAVVDAVKLPVTVKTRLGWDTDSINILDTAPMLEQAGAAALTIHCRTRSQGHSGNADWSWIPRIKERVSIPVFLNGDVNSPEAADRAFRETGCDGVMIARAAISNPFIFREIKEYFAAGSYSPASLEERIEFCLNHLRHSIEIRGEHAGIPNFRKYYLGYFKGIYGAAKLRAELMLIWSFAEVEEKLWQFAAVTKEREQAALLVAA